MSDISQIVMPDNTEYDIKDAYAREQISSKPGVYYGTCSTAANQQIKTVTVSNDQNFSLRKGCIVGVKYSVSNTFSATASKPVKLNVNSTGEKQIYYGNTATPTGTNTNAFGYANRIVYYMYNGTYWAWMSHDTDNDTDSGNYNLRFPYNPLAAEAITAYRLCCATSVGYKMIGSGVYFHTDYPLLYSTTAATVGAGMSNSYLIANGRPLTELKSELTGTEGAMVYLVGSSYDGRIFTIDSTIVSTTAPSSEDGKYYSPIGMVLKNDPTKFNFIPSSRVFAFFNGLFQEVVGGALTVPSTGVKIVQLTSENLNDIKTEGEYFAAVGNTVTSIPTGVTYFGLKVVKIATNGYTQLLYFKDIVYVRYWNKVTWSSWSRILQEQDIVTCTQAEYDALTNKTANYYFIVEDD